MIKNLFLLNILFVFLMTFSACCSGMHYLNQGNLNINPESSAYLCTEDKKIKINTCNHLNSQSSIAYLLSKLNDNAIQNSRGNSEYIPHIEEATFYLLCSECVELYIFSNIKDEINPEFLDRSKYMYEKVVKGHSELHAITCNHKCPNNGKVFEIYSGFLTVLNRPLSIQVSRKDNCDSNAIQKFSVYKGYKSKGNVFRFINDMFLTRKPAKETRKKISVEFPIE